MKVTVVRADYGQHTQAFKQNGYVGIGWFDAPLLERRDRVSIREHYEQRFPDHNPNTVSQNVGQVFRFLNEIHPGDLVLTPYSDGPILVGRVKGEPYGEHDATSPYDNRIPVDWLPEPLDRHALSIPLQNTLKSSLTVFNVSQVADVCEAAGIPYTPEEGKRPTPIQAERVELYEAVRGVLLHLNDQEFETLVSYVLRTLGFEASQPTGHVGDGGIDFEGELRVMGVASVRLQVQVKRYARTAIGELEIRNFRGALKRDHQGCFITLSDFQRKARASASSPDRTPINLINGRQFIEIMTEQYERLLELLRAEDSDELAEKLRFRKALVPA